MIVEYCGEEFEVPDLIVEKYIDDFKGLPGGTARQSIYELRDNIEEMLEIVALQPDILEEPGNMSDFIAALAMRRALEVHGVLYDA